MEMQTDHQYNKKKTYGKLKSINKKEEGKSEQYKEKQKQINE